MATLTTVMSTMSAHPEDEHGRDQLLVVEVEEAAAHQTFTLT
jgi:hypothetical protein